METHHQYRVIAMSSSDHHSLKQETQVSFPKMLFDGWLSLGPKNLWFYVVPLMFLATLASLIKQLFV
jgi:hypothetical protein